jgi:hypothetical protein
MTEEQGEEILPRVTKWDYLALLSETIGTIFAAITNFFIVASSLIDHHASFVEEQRSFHEYAARTIETLQEGE